MAVELPTGHSGARYDLDLHHRALRRHQAITALQGRGGGFVFTNTRGESIKPIVAAIRRDVANSVGGLLWKPTEPPAPDAGDDATDDPAPAA